MSFVRVGREVNKVADLLTTQVIFVGMLKSSLTYFCIFCILAVHVLTIPLEKLKAAPWKKEARLTQKVVVYLRL